MERRYSRSRDGTDITQVNGGDQPSSNDTSTENLGYGFQRDSSQPIWYSLSGDPMRSEIVGGPIVPLLILLGLVPYHWNSIANSFSWVPFGGFLATDRDFGLLTLLKKFFWYVSAVWLLRPVAWQLTSVAVVAALLLGVIETIQIYRPRRMAGITDPLLALILAVSFGLLERS